MRIKGIARRRSVAEQVGSRRRSQGRRQPLRHRGLRIEQFEERTLLSVAPLNTLTMCSSISRSLPPTIWFSKRTADGETSSTLTPMLAGKSVATDNNGDFVVTWQQNDAVGITDPATGQPMTDANIYARYYTDAVQRIDLPAGLPVSLYSTTATRFRNCRLAHEHAVRGPGKHATAVGHAVVAGTFDFGRPDHRF